MDEKTNEDKYVLTVRAAFAAGWEQHKLFIQNFHGSTASDEAGILEALAVAHGEIVRNAAFSGSCDE